MKHMMMALCLGILLASSYCQYETNRNLNSLNSETNITANIVDYQLRNSQTNLIATQQTNGTTNSTSNSTDISCSQPCDSIYANPCQICSTICTNTTTGEVVSYKMDSCQYSQCNQWISDPRSPSDTTDTLPKCNDWTILLLSEQNCASSCCTSSSFTVFTYQNYQSCIQTDNNLASIDNKTSIIVAAVLSSGLVSIILLVIIICCRQRISVCCQNFIYSIQTLFTGESIKKPKDQTSTQESERPIKVKKFKWQSIHSKKKLSELPTSKYIVESQYDINPQIYCSICLDSEMNTETHCKHQFHFLCLKKKVDKKFVCPQCQHIDFNPLKITCDICMQKQTKFSIDKKNIDEKPSFLIHNKIYCDDCFNKHVRSGHIKQVSKD